MSSDVGSGLDAILKLPVNERVDTLVERALALARAGVNPRDDGEAGALAATLVHAIEDGTGDAHQRLRLGEALGLLGDPRLRHPAEPEYWVRVPFGDGSALDVGRFMVTTWEYRRWVEAGGWEADEHWSEEGRRWRDSRVRTWLQLASADDVDHLVVPNQPVVGVSWWEAEAYARAHGARLLTSAERRWVVRGPNKRPYPWGEPFGSGNANTREEALQRPCAVGLYTEDRTPEGVCDLAGNVAEWVADGENGDRFLHPGSWTQPSMASWAKALERAPAKTRSADLGFRLARSVEA